MITENDPVFLWFNATSNPNRIGPVPRSFAMDVIKRWVANRRKAFEGDEEAKQFMNGMYLGGTTCVESKKEWHYHFAICWSHVVSMSIQEAGTSEDEKSKERLERMVRLQEKAVKIMENESGANEPWRQNDDDN